MAEMKILSIQVGMPAERIMSGLDDGSDRPWTSGIFKERASGAIFLGETNLSGDGQADLKHHGGPDRAVLMFPESHYPKWEAAYQKSFPRGGFGENFTIAGATENSICLGDIWETENVRLEISQPRLPCFKLGRRLGEPSIVAKVMEAHEGGWYARVLRQGTVGEDEVLRLVSRPHPDWTVSRGFAEFVFGRDNLVALAELNAISALSQLWRDRLTTLLATKEN